MASILLRPLPTGFKKLPKPLVTWGSPWKELVDGGKETVYFTDDSATP